MNEIRLKVFLSLLFVVLLFTGTANADQWAKSYDGVGYEFANSIQQTSDGGFIVAGKSYSFVTTDYDIIVLKLDSNSNVVWKKKFGGAENDEAYSVKQTADGGYIVAGGFGTGYGTYDNWVLKLDGNGNIVWQKKYGSGGIAYSIQQTTDGGYIVASSEWGSLLGYLWILKLDSNGGIVWQKNYNLGDSWIKDIQQTSDGGYIVADVDSLLRLDNNGNILWQKKYSNKPYFAADIHSIKQTSDGGYIAAGYIGGPANVYNDIWLFKLNSNGDMVWQKAYGSTAAWEDVAYSARQTTDGGYIVAGHTMSFGAGSFDIWVLKVDSNGNIIWQKTYGGPNEEYARSIQQTSDGDFIVAGTTYSFVNTFSDIWILKINGNGDIPGCANIQTSNATVTNLTVNPVNTTHTFTTTTETPINTYESPVNINSPTTDVCYNVSISHTLSVAKTGSGSGYITSFPVGINCGADCTELYSQGTVVTLTATPYSGSVFSGWSGDPDCGDGIITMTASISCSAKFDIYTPQQGWIKTFGGTIYDMFDKILHTSDGGYIAAGYTTSYGAGSGDMWILKLDEIGNVTWEKTYGGTGTEGVESIQQTTDGGYIVAGITSSYGAGSGDLWVLKIDGNGVVVWQKTYGSSWSERARSIQQTSDGGYIVAGESTSFGIGTNDLWVLKLDGNGNVVWQYIYGGTGEDIGYSIQQASNGNYIVTGSTTSFGAGGADIWVLSLGSTGNVLWQNTYGGTGNDIGKSILQTTDGNYILTGHTTSFRTGNDIWVLKLDPWGNILWQKTYGGPNNNYYAYSIQQTSDGGFIVSGDTNASGAGSYDVLILKLDASGNVIRQKTYGGTDIDSAKSIIQTSDGGYIAAGITYSFGSGWADAWVLKLADLGEVTGCAVMETPQVTITDTNISKQNTSTAKFNSNGLVANSIASVQNSATGWNWTCSYLLPDLIVDNIKTTPTTPVVGQNVDVVITFKNQGSSLAGNFYVDFYKSNPKFPPAPFQNGDFFCKVFLLGPGNSSSCSGTVSYSAAGNYAIWAQVDTDQTITESDEANNVFGPQTITVQPSITTFTLSITKSGTGSGTVTSNPVGINCGVDCSEPYNNGAVVTLTYTPDIGSVFGGWSGDPDCSDSSVTMNADKSCTATFNIIQHTLTVTKSGTGTGTVTSSPIGINCGADCSEPYNYGTTVTLTAAPDTGSVFAGWGGVCNNTGLTCVVTMDAAKTAAAAFNLALPNVSVTLVPDSTSVPRGGTLGYTVTVKNNTSSTQTFKYWTYVILPNNSRYPATGELYGPVNVTLIANQSLSAHMTHNIPMSAPLGTYTYFGNVGPYSGVWDNDTFQFTVTATTTSPVSKGDSWQLLEDGLTK